MKTLVALILLASLSACALPETSVRTGTARPKLSFPNAAPDMILVVDGIMIGPAARYDGNPGVLLVEEGVHLLELKQGGQTIHSEKTLVANGETRAITVNSGSK
jgi:hypothetical protein